MLIWALVKNWVHEKHSHAQHHGASRKMQIRADDGLVFLNIGGQYHATMITGPTITVFLCEDRAQLLQHPMSTFCIEVMFYK